MCLICERISMIKQGTNPYFIKELETGYVVLGDHHFLKAIHFFYLRNMYQNFIISIIQPN